MQKFLVARSLVYLVVSNHLYRGNNLTEEVEGFDYFFFFFLKSETLFLDLYIQRSLIPPHQGLWATTLKL